MNELNFKEKLFAWSKKNKTDLIVYFGFIFTLILLITVAVLPQYKSSVTSVPPKQYNSIAIAFGDSGIAWYAIFILSGIILAAFMAFKEFKKLGWDPEDLLDGLLIIVPLSILGARLYYVLTSDVSLLDFFKIRDGGLAIHGAIIVATISVIIFSRVKKLSVFVVADVLAIGFLIGQIAGRWGNFMNAEAHGSPVYSPFLNAILPNFIKHQMRFGDEGMLGVGSMYLPTFLIESIWNFVGLTILLVIRRKRILKTGDILGIYLIWYGFGRGILIEPFRTDPLWMFGMRANVLMSLLLFVGGGILYLILKRVFIKDEPYYADLTNNEHIPFVREKKKANKKKKVYLDENEYYDKKYENIDNWDEFELDEDKDETKE